MVQSGQDRDGGDVADTLDRSRYRCILVQCKMRAGSVVIACIGQHDTAQVTLAIDQHLIQALPVKRPIQTFRDTVLPGRYTPSLQRAKFSAGYHRFMQIVATEIEWARFG
jgi:hypothetical protein